MRLPPHKTRFDFANSLHPARYRDNAPARDTLIRRKNSLMI